MNRSEEFKKIVEIFRSESKPGGEEQVDVEKDKEVISKPVSAFIVLCMDTNKALYDNEILVQKMDKL